MTVGAVLVLCVACSAASSWLTGWAARPGRGDVAFEVVAFTRFVHEVERELEYQLGIDELELAAEEYALGGSPSDFAGYLRVVQEVMP